MPDVRHTLVIAATPEQTWPFLTTAEGVAKWWTLGDASLTGALGEHGVFYFRSRGVVSRMEVTALTPPNQVAWRAVESNAPGGWEGTSITFDLAPDGPATRLDFAHRGFADDDEGYRRVTAGWAHYLQNLKRLIELESDDAPAHRARA